MDGFLSPSVSPSVSQLLLETKFGEDQILFTVVVQHFFMYLLGHMSYLDNTQRRNVYQVVLLSRVLRMSGLIFMRSM